MKYLLWLTFLSSICVADTSALNGAIPTPPNVNQNGTQAFQKASEATLMQLGITKQVNDWQSYYGGILSKDANEFIDNNLPVKHDTVYTLLGAGYVLGVQHQVQGQFQCPFLSNVQNTVNISPNSGVLGFKLSF